jgi:hypothetical protein
MPTICRSLAVFFSLGRKHRERPGLFELPAAVAKEGGRFVFMPDLARNAPSATEAASEK